MDVLYDYIIQNIKSSQVGDLKEQPKISINHFNIINTIQ